MKYQADDKIGQLKLSIAFKLIPGLPPIQNIDYRLIVIDPPGISPLEKLILLTGAGVLIRR